MKISLRRFPTVEKCGHRTTGQSNLPQSGLSPKLAMPQKFRRLRDGFAVAHEKRMTGG
jgi:hypothetical protein